MKKVLIISYYWPPSGGAGVQRWLKFVKYLRLYGWEPVVYVPENPEYPELDTTLFRDVPEGLEILRQPIREPYNAYKRLMGQKKDQKINAAFLSEKKKNRLLEKISVWIRGNLFIPDARKFWIRPSVNFLSTYLKNHPVDAIVSTGPPHSMHLIAMPLAARFNKPWLADFRDPWTSIDFYKDLMLTRWADHKHHRLEIEVLRNASAVTVISNTMAAASRSIHDRHYDVITNGFDSEDIKMLPPPVPDLKFSIAHIGTLVSSRNPGTLWKALGELLEEVPGFADNLEIKLVGKVDFIVTKAIEQAGLQHFVRKIDYMPHDEVVKCQQQSQVLLLIINNTPNAKMILTGKFFEYLAAKRPILCLGPPDGDAAAILDATAAGLHAGFDDTNAMKRNVLAYYNQYLAGTLNVDPEGISQYSRRELTRTLASILDRITATT
jgi:glycosyltransferase involved in cell wall biosynthesis